MPNRSTTPVAIDAEVSVCMYLRAQEGEEKMIGIKKDKRLVARPNLRSDRRSVCGARGGAMMTAWRVGEGCGRSWLLLLPCCTIITHFYSRIMSIQLIIILSLSSTRKITDERPVTLSEPPQPPDPRPLRRSARLSPDTVLPWKKAMLESIFNFLYSFKAIKRG